MLEYSSSLFISGNSLTHLWIYVTVYLNVSKNTWKITYGKTNFTEVVCCFPQPDPYPVAQLRNIITWSSHRNWPSAVWQHLPKSKQILELPGKRVIQALTKWIQIFVEVTKSLNFDISRFEKFWRSCMNEILHITVWSLSAGFHVVCEAFSMLSSKVFTFY